MTTDPVCKMEVDPTKAAARVDYAGQTYYFCSDSCHHAFTVDPQKYAADASQGSHSESHHHGNK